MSRESQTLEQLHQMMLTAAQAGFDLATAFRSPRLMVDGFCAQSVYTFSVRDSRPILERGLLGERRESVAEYFYRHDVSMRQPTRDALQDAYYAGQILGAKCL